LCPSRRKSSKQCCRCIGQDRVLFVSAQHRRTRFAAYSRIWNRYTTRYSPHLPPFAPNFVRCGKHPAWNIPAVAAAAGGTCKNSGWAGTCDRATDQSLARHERSKSTSERDCWYWCAHSECDCGISGRRQELSQRATVRGLDWAGTGATLHWRQIKITRYQQTRRLLSENAVDSNNVIFCHLKNAFRAASLSHTETRLLLFGQFGLLFFWSSCYEFC